jgi:serine O-acetyltransferase
MTPFEENFAAPAHLASPVAPAKAERIEPLSWKETRARFHADRERLSALLQSQPGACALLFLHPSLLCALLYRISHHFFRGDHWLWARLVWQLNFLVTGADISPAADLGPGLLVLAPAGTAIMGVAGRNLTVMPCSGMGGEMGNLEDVGAGPGLPLVGDDVVLEPHSGILGPVRVGDRVRVGANVGLAKDTPDDSDVEGPQPRFIPRKDIR